MLPDDALNRLRQQVQMGFGVVISIGTSAVFPYIQDPIIRARRQGNLTVEINPSQTPLSHHVDYHLAQGATAALEEIWTAYRELKEETSIS